MNCPYCLSEVAEEAVVCKTCSRDLYLFKPLIAKIAELEKQIQEVQAVEEYENRIRELEYLLEEQRKKHEPRTFVKSISEVILCLLIPFALLLLAHWLIEFVFDTKTIYLRIISMVLPMLFAYGLFKRHPHKVVPWLFGAIILAISSVIGMSWVTSLIDHVPVLPQNLSDWKEYAEYALSITFSFVTGMLLGSMSYASQNHYQGIKVNPLVKFILNFKGDEKMSPEGLHNLMKKINEYGGTIIALATTGLSIYTGLKHVI